jgi:hypothetical protein
MLTKNTDTKSVTVSKLAKKSVKSFLVLIIASVGARRDNDGTYIHPMMTSNGITKVEICYRSMSITLLGRSQTRTYDRASNSYAHSDFHLAPEGHPNSGEMFRSVGL